MIAYRLALLIGFMSLYVLSFFGFIALVLVCITLIKAPWKGWK